jgi:hypothetical protein
MKSLLNLIKMFFFSSREIFRVYFELNMLYGESKLIKSENKESIFAGFWDDLMWELEE